MELNALENFYLQQKEPVRGCYLALREIILSQDENVTNEYKYGGSFFCYHGKMFCYLWFHKKLKVPYIAFVEGNKLESPLLIQENRSRIKILLLDPNEDLPISTITNLLGQALNLYRTGEIKIKGNKNAIVEPQLERLNPEN